jgi:hypothetical protein
LGDFVELCQMEFKDLVFQVEKAIHDVGVDPAAARGD